MTDHLDDGELNEYLDGALAAERQAAVADHLAACPECQARLAELNALFASLDGLGDLPLRRDLAPAILKVVQRRPVTQLQPAADPRRSLFYVIFAAQALVATTLLAVAWPALAGRVAALASLTLPLRQLLSDALRALSAASDLSPQLSYVDRLQQSLRSAVAALPFGLPELEAVVIGAAVLWLLGNAWLLGRPLASLIRRHS